MLLRAAMVRNIIPDLALSCRAGSTEELRSVKEYLGYFSSAKWIDEATEAAALDHQKGLLTSVAPGNTIDDLYEMAVVALVLQDYWTREDIARYANAVQTKIRAVFKTIMSTTSSRKQEADLDEFIQFAGVLGDIGFVSEDQIVALLSR